MTNGRIRARDTWSERGTEGRTEDEKCTDQTMEGRGKNVSQDVS